ncbi:MAG: DUF3050 domain-containing protein [Rhodobacterales bacterium]|nr:DUF3050 domain-containing protein [Rhodobacterales bacterium]
MKDPRTFLSDLREEIAAHPGVNHLLLNRLATAPFSREDYRIFAENHIPLVSVFTVYLELLLLRAPDSEARLWLAKVLVDEYGEGSDGHDHVKMYGRFLTAAGGDAEVASTSPVPSPAQTFIETHANIVRNEPFLVGLGAVGPGHEWAIPKMFESIIPGLRRARFPEVEIDYFTLHVEQDDDHGNWLGEALAGYATTEEAQAQILRGARLSLEARRVFWDGVQQAIVRYRQPHAIRPDGLKPRTIAHEVFLTAWDGNPMARAIQQAANRWRNRDTLTLAAVVDQARRLS